MLRPPGWDFLGTCDDLQHVSPPVSPVLQNLPRHWASQITLPKEIMTQRKRRARGGKNKSRALGERKKAVKISLGVCFRFPGGKEAVLSNS